MSLIICYHCGQLCWTEIVEVSRRVWRLKIEEPVARVDSNLEAAKENNKASPTRKVQRSEKRWWFYFIISLRRHCCSSRLNFILILATLHLAWINYKVEAIWRSDNERAWLILSTTWRQYQSRFFFSSSLFLFFSSYLDLVFAVNLFIEL